VKPTKPKTDNRSRVLRGGAWGNFDAAWVRAAARSAGAPALRYDSLGFRLTQTGCRQQILKGVTPP
jgi:formylglycine-generating enzyme required for sulfatase activity